MFLNYNSFSSYYSLIPFFILTLSNTSKLPVEIPTAFDIFGLLQTLGTIKNRDSLKNKIKYEAPCLEADIANP